ncbi:MAG: epimerase [Ignavibacteriaceae bacterium]|nr:epimerase [Ignavibacteriaceae bacterium]
MRIKSIIFGATGMVGEGVLLHTLDHPDVGSVLVVGRRPCGIVHNKLKEVIYNDFFNFTSIKEQLKGYNACFFCLGTSSLGMKEKDYYQVTYELTLQAASVLSELNPDMTFCYVSGAGTDSSEKGRLMWARVKGKTENQLLTFPFKAAYLFRPGFMQPVKGQKNPNRLFKMMGYIYPLFKLLFPNAGCKLQDLASAMIICSKVGYTKHILENKDIDFLAGTDIRSSS